MQKESLDFKQLLEWQEQRWGTDHPKVIATLESMADSMQMQGRYGDAEPYYWQILEKKHKLYGPDDLKVADTIYDLACLQEKLGNFEECERLYKWTCDIRCKHLPQGDAQLADALGKMGEIAAKQGKEFDRSTYKTAEALATAHRKTNFDWESSLQHVRLLLMEQNYAVAELLLHVLTDAAESFEPGSKAHANCQHLLARVKFLLRKNDESLKAFEKALNLYEKHCGINSIETAACLEDMADLHCKRSEKAEAEFLFKWALQILGGIMAESPNLEAENQSKRINTKLDSIEDLCVAVALEPDFSSEEKALFGDQDPGDEAGDNDKNKETEDDTRLEEEMLSPVDVPAYLWHQFINSAQKARTIGDLAQTELMYSRALQKANEFGYQDARLWQTLSEYASVYAEQGKYVRAEALYQSAQQYCEKTVGNLNPKNTVYWEQLARLYEKLEENAKAAHCFDKIVTIMAKNNRPLLEYANYLKKLERLQSRATAEFFD